MRVIFDLADPARRPPRPGDEGRRYWWIDNMKVGSSLSEEDSRQFNADADQILFELIDNVHEWAWATGAVACCSVTRGGGPASHNRLHIVVIDDGIGIVASVQNRRERELLAPWDSDPAIVDQSEALKISKAEVLLQILVTEAFDARAVGPPDRGQGLHAVGDLSKQWSGTLRLYTSDGLTCNWVERVGSSGSS